MILENKNLFLADTTLEQGLKAINIIKDKFKDTSRAIILGVEFECDRKEAGRIDSDKIMTPIVSCLLHGVSGVHNYRVDVVEKTIELKH